MFEAGWSSRKALRAVKVLQGMLGRLARHRSLDSFESVLVDEASYPLKAFVTRLLPNAELVDQSADLRLAFSVLTGLTADEQAEWLRRAHDLLKPGGFLAASFHGELMRPFLAGSEPGRLLDATGLGRDGQLTYQTKSYTVKACSELFEVVDYVEGGIDDREDLILLRR